MRQGNRNSNAHQQRPKVSPSRVLCPDNSRSSTNLRKNKRFRSVESKGDAYYVDLSYGYSTGHRPKYLSLMSSFGKCNDMEIVLPFANENGKPSIYCPPPAMTFQELELQALHRDEIEKMKITLKLNDKELKQFETDLIRDFKMKSYKTKYVSNNVEIRSRCSKFTSDGISINQISRRASSSSRKRFTSFDYNRKDKHILKGNNSSKHYGLFQGNLQAELNHSRTNLNNLSSSIKEDIASIQWLCRKFIKNTGLCDDHIHARKHLRAWATDRIVCYIQLAIVQKKAEAFQRWNRVVSAIRKNEKWLQFLIYQGFIKITYAVYLLNYRKLLYHWNTWQNFVDHCRKVETKNLELKCTLILQSWSRMLAAKVYTSYLRKLFANRIVTRIQTSFRRKCAMKFKSKLFRQRRKLCAVVMIQCAHRCQLSRSLTRKLAEERRFERGAICIQKLARGIADRKLAAMAKYEYTLCSSAMRIQRIWRGYLGKKESDDRKIARKRERASISIQSQFRMSLSKDRVCTMKKEARKMVRLRHQSVLVLQRKYRTHRRTVLSKLELATQVALARRRFRAATTVQSIFRQSQAKAFVKRLAKQDLNSMISSAKRWKEAWDDTSSCWYYYDVGTENTLWEPPSTGYTKSDTRLVLQNGKVIDDLHIGVPEIVFEICTECSTSIATRHCDQCDDKYCTVCYNTVHPNGGRRALHTYTCIGPIECEECGREIAIRWCTQCDDPFCDMCWDKVHSRGNRTNHGHCIIRSDGTVSPRAWRADGSTAGMYMPGSNIQQQSISEYKQYGDWHTSDRNDGEPDAYWHYQNELSEKYSQHYDESGNIYYFNNETGESSYEAPVGIYPSENLVVNHA